MAKDHKGGKVWVVMRTAPSAKAASLWAIAVTQTFSGEVAVVAYPRLQGAINKRREVRDKGVAGVVTVRHLMAQMGK